MNLTLSQISPKLNRESNIEKHLQIIEKCKNSSNIIVFPELSLNGYLMMDLVFEDSFELYELNVLQKASFDVDILIGLALREKHKVYNAGIYFSKGKILHIHKKNLLPNYGMFEEARYFFKANKIEAFESDFGIGVNLICEDLWSSEIINEVVKLNPDIVYVIANSPARDFNKSDKLLIETKWEALLKTLAILSGAYVIFVNRVGFEDGVGFWGKSKIISPNSEILCEANGFEEDIVTFKLENFLLSREKYFLRG